MVCGVTFADDQGMVGYGVCSSWGLQMMMNKLNYIVKKYSMKIDTQKQKQWIMRWVPEGVVTTGIDGRRVEQVSNFKYLGLLISEDGRCLVDVRTRIACAKDAFNKRRNLLTEVLSRTPKKSLAKILIWPIVLYGCESLTLLQD